MSPFLGAGSLPNHLRRGVDDDTVRTGVAMRVRVSVEQGWQCSSNELRYAGLHLRVGTIVRRSRAHVGSGAIILGATCMNVTPSKYAIWFLLVVLSLPSVVFAETRQIVALGDSNTAGFLVGKRNAFPALLEKSLRNSGYDVAVSNRGISGDTSAGMLARLDESVPSGTTLVIVQGGYNDKRRGITPSERDANIETILERLSRRGVKVVLCGLSGARWSGIAQKHNAQFVDGSTCYDVDNRGFDRLHMNRAGHRVVAIRLVPVVEKALGRR